MNEVRTSVVPLPATREDMANRKDMKTQLTLNDHVDSIHMTMWDNADYRQLLDATSDEDAVEGSLAIDNAKAAEMIRKHAEVTKNPYVAKKKLATIVKALNVVLRRYHMTRRERAITIGGETYPGE
jgi:hypothetical protein